MRFVSLLPGVFAAALAALPIAATAAVSYTVTPAPAGPNGSIAPDTPQTVTSGNTTSFTVTPNANYYVLSVSSNCGPTVGPSLSPVFYMTSPVTADCTVTPVFQIVNYVVTANTANFGGHGFISPPIQNIDHGSTATFTLFPDPGYTAIMGGTCPIGSLVGNTYTTGPITASCQVSPTFVAPRLQVAASNDVMAAGFTVSGGNKTVGIVAAGPSLSGFGVASPLANPALTILDFASQSVLAANDDWQTAANASQVQASGIAPSNPLEAAIYYTFVPGTYLALVQASGTGPGVSAIRLHDLNGSADPLVRNASLTFGSHFVGGPSTVIEMAVINDGGADLVITPASIGISGTHAGDFTISSNTCASVPPGSSCTIGLGFVAGATGSRSAALTLPSNDPETPVTTVILLGTGVPIPQFTLAAATAGSGAGVVSGTGFDCPGDCSEVVDSGTLVTLSAAADTGSTFAGWSGGGCSGTGTCAVTVTADTTVTATFTLNQYTVTPSAGANGSISPSTGVLVNHGATTSFTVTPGAGFTASVGGNCGGSLVGDTYTTDAIVANCTVVASFTIKTYTVTPSAGANGTMSPGTPQAVNHGATTSFTVTPDAGHEIASVTGCGGSLAGSAYTTGPITASCSVTASFQVPNPPRMGNISTRMQVGAGNDVLIGGFVIGGSANKTVAIVATGPSLAQFGIASSLANPTLTLVRSSDQVTIATNDDWQSAANSAQLATAGFAPSNPLEAAILVSLPPGAYTAIVEGVGGGTGVSVIGVYEVDGPAIPLVNISTRGRVLTGNDVMIGGFVIQGSAPQTVAIVATGPSLTQFGIASPLANPTITLVRSSDQATIATNDDWQGDLNSAQLQAAGFAPTNPLESGLYRTLPPGAYTVIVQGVGGGTGVAVIGVYKVN